MLQCAVRSSNNALLINEIGLADTDILKYYGTINTEEGEPPRELGHYGKICPVTYYNTSKTIEGDFMYAALYRVCLKRVVYLPSSKC